MEGNAEKQNKKQYDWLKQYQWQKGQSGNPNGRPPGKSLKTFVKEMLEEMDEEAKAEFLKNIDPELVWKMAEGNPPQSIDAKVEAELKIDISEKIAEKYGLTPQPEQGS